MLIRFGSDASSEIVREVSEEVKKELGKDISKEGPKTKQMRLKLKTRIGESFFSKVYEFVSNCKQKGVFGEKVFLLVSFASIREIW